MAEQDLRCKRDNCRYWLEDNKCLKTYVIIDRYGCMCFIKESKKESKKED